MSRGRCYIMNASGAYGLAASYGFPSRSGPEEGLEPGHPLIEWVQRHRQPTLINSPQDAGVLEETMERDRYARCLTAPIYSGSRLVGILELQNKQNGAPFDGEDISAAGRLVGHIEALLLERDDISVGEPEPMAQEDRDALFLDSLPDPAPPVARASFSSAGSLRSGSSAAVPSAGRAAPGASVTGGASELSRREALVLKGFTNALLLSPEIDAVIFSHWTGKNADLFIGSRRPFSPAGREVLLRNLESALLSVVPGGPVPGEKIFHVEFPFGRSAGEIHEPGGVQTSVIFSGESTLLLSLVFPRPPVLTPEAALKETHRLVRAAILQVREAERYHRAYRSLVPYLIEPGTREFPQLKMHSLGVASLCRRFAAALRLPAETVEQFTVAGLLHDIGLKDLAIPYERISGRRPLDAQELSVVRQHAAVGSSLLSRIEWPYEIALIVRHHHERFDGAGYPDRLVGDRIPLGSRVVAIAEAYDAMVSPQSYRAPISREKALDIIRLKGGTQFDPELTRRFSDLVRSIPSTEEESLSPLEP